MTAYIKLERIIVLFALTRLALIAAIVSNVDKAAWAFKQVSEAGAASPYWLAGALEAMLGIAAYATLDAIQQKRKPGALLAMTGVFALISVTANIAYFVNHLVGGAGILETGAAVFWGLAAPGVALACGVIGGATVGAEAEKQEHAHQDEHALRLAELAAVTAQAEASAARAEARRAKLESVAAVTAQPTAQAEREPVTTAQGPIMTGAAAWTFDDFERDVHAGAVMLADVSGQDIGQRYGVSEATGRRWKRALAGSNGAVHEPIKGMEVVAR